MMLGSGGSTSGPAPFATGLVGRFQLVLNSLRENTMREHAYASMMTLMGLVACCGTGCEQKPQPTVPAADSSASAAALPAGLFVDAPPAGARNVAEVKADAEASGEVVIQGRIGGRPEPFVNGAALFLLADSAVKTCDELHGDGCPTPWDYCCEPRESLAAGTATVQVLGADGRPLRVGLNGQHGLSPKATVTLVGDVAPRVDTSTLVINARRIHVHRVGN